MDNDDVDSMKYAVLSYTHQMLIPMDKLPQLLELLQYSTPITNIWDSARKGSVWCVRRDTNPHDRPSLVFLSEADVTFAKVYGRKKAEEEEAKKDGAPF